MLRPLLYLLALFAIPQLHSQTAVDSMLDSLRSATEELMMDDEVAVRMKAMEDTKELILQILDRDASFEISFDSLFRISVQYPADSSFRVFTGQLFINEKQYQYYGILQLRDKERSPIVLQDRSDVIRFPKDAQLTPAQWYGAVYYNIKRFESGGSPHYLMFGYNAYGLYQRQKLIDVLTFDAQGQPVFGAPVFNHPEHPDLNRFILQYAADVGVRLNYDEELQMIVLDHLIPMKSPYGGQSVALVPDGSYCGFTLQDGNWSYVPKVFHEVLTEAPRDKPVFTEENRDKDIFGRKKN